MCASVSHVDSMHPVWLAPPQLQSCTCVCMFGHLCVIGKLLGVGRKEKKRLCRLVFYKGDPGVDCWVYTSHTPGGNQLQQHMEHLLESFGRPHIQVFRSRSCNEICPITCKSFWFGFQAQIVTYLGRPSWTPGFAHAKPYLSLGARLWMTKCACDTSDLDYKG